MADIVGRDGLIITEALAFAYAAMKHLPQMFQPLSNMEDMRALLFARLGREQAEFQLGQAMLTAWNLRADVPPSAGKDDLRHNLRRIREQVLLEPPPLTDPEGREGASDTAILVQHIDRFLAL